MKKVLFLLFCLILGATAVAQNKIQFRSADKAECVKSDMTSLKATFSFSGLEAQKVETERGTFSEIYIEGAYPNGNVGEPQLPMFTRLIAIPTGATPNVTVGSHSETSYTLSDYGIGTISAMQAPIRKDVEPSTVAYAYNEAAYARNSYNDDPIAMVEVLGTMRGITMGRLIVQPVRYNPAAGTVKVYNDIEVTVNFENGDAKSTEEMFHNTFSPAFTSVYDQIFNIDMLTGGTRDAYTDHPDMYNTPVKMLVICYSGFKNNSALTSWLQWKLQKGYYVDIYYTDETGTTASAIASFIKTKYNASVSAGNAYTYLIVIGDTGQVPQYMTKTVDESCASDLGYSSVNFSSNTSNYFPDMYYSRMSVENTTHLTNYINKVLTYEKYEFTDGGNYLNNVILVGGWDSNWTSRVAKPTINYATNYYFKSSNTTYGGFENGTISATISTSSTAGYSGSNNGCYNGINNGVCFLNYTAHGDKQEWYQPKMTAAHVATLTNTGKYFFGVGNCCLTGNFNNTSTTYSPGSAIGTNACFAETMIRVPNAGAVAYVGCSPYSYWYEDFYWAVGAHSYSAGNYPTQSASSKGVYDIMFEDQYWNSASSLLYVGNLAVQQAVSNGNTNSSVTDGNCNNSAHYYFQFYHTFGDGSVMPYITKPEANTVTIPSTVTPGTTSITVNAVAGSYVAVTDNSSVIYGVAEANTSGVATVNFTNAIPNSGTLYVVVTRQQYQPYFGTITVQGGTQYNITTKVTPTNSGTVTGAGSYYENTQCTLTATPATGYTFTNWKKGNSVVSTNASYTFTVSSTTAGEYTATFTAIPQYTITASANPTNGGTVTGGGTFYENTSCTLTATANTGYAFSKWTKNGTQVSTNPTYTFTVTAAGSYVANFDQLVAHSVTCNTVEGGTISASVSSAYMGDEVTLTATADDGYFFSAWDVRDANNSPITVSNNKFTMPNSNVTVSATFVQGCNVTIADVEHGTVTASATFAVPGTTITLTGTPATDYVLSRWMVFKTGDVREGVAVTGNSFVLPAYDVTVVGIFKMTKEAEVAIGSGTSADSYLPTYAYYNYSLTQQIYTASEVGQAGTITKIAFKVSNSKSTSRTLDVYLKHTTKTAFSSQTGWETVSSSDKVFSGSVAFQSSGWTTITLSTPFEYDGTSNLVVCVDDNTGSYVSSSNNSPKFYVYSTNANRALRIYSDGTNYTATSPSSYTGTYVTSNNQITFTMTTSGSDASLTVSPNVLSGFTYAEGSGTTDAQSFAIIGVDLTEDITVTAPEAFVISDEEHGTYGSSLTLTSGSKGNRETLTYDFETGWQNWTTFQGSTTSPNSWMHNTEYPTSNNDFTSGYGYSSSDGFMLSESYISGSSSGTGTAVTPDNYLVSPQVTLGGSITFHAGVQNVSYCAEKFSLMVSTTGSTSASDFTTVQTWTYSANATSGSEWQEFTVDLSAYSGTGYIAIRHFDCNDQWILKIDDVNIVQPEDSPVNPTDPTIELLTANVYVRLKTNLTQGNYTGTAAVTSGEVTSNVTLNGEVTEGEYTNYTITAVANPAEGGTVSGAGVYHDQATPHLIATANEGYHFVNWTENGVEVSTESTYLFTCDGNRDLVANFSETVPAVEQTITLAQGWNWFSSPLVADDLIDQVENSLQDNAKQITSKNSGFDQYNPSNGNWIGNLNSIAVENKYRIQTNNACQIAITGNNANPAEHPITLNKGANWIGYPLSSETTLNDALADFTPETGDRFESKNDGFAEYSGTKWIGTLAANGKTLKPGQGYIYRSKADDSKQLVYSASGKGDDGTVQVDEPSFWKADNAAFADIMCVTALVEIDGIASDDIELAAFVDGQCRGAVRMIYVESLKQHLAFLTVGGNDGETVSFKALANGNVVELEETERFSAAEALGSLNRPVVLHSASGTFALFPNPAERGEQVQIALPDSFDAENATIEVFNALGARVNNQALNKGALEIQGMTAAGLYTVKVTDRQGNVLYGKLVVK